MDKIEIASLASQLDQARLTAQPRERLTLKYPQLSLADGYKIQAEGIILRQNRGENVFGYKMGLTSQAKMEQVSLNSPIYGVLLDSTLINAEDSFSLQKSIHAKIEPEIAFILGQDLGGVVTEEQAINACEWACAAMEIIDSRFLHFKYFSLPDVVADNCSASHFILGPTRRNPKELDLSKLAMTMKINSETATAANSDAILGNPIRSVVHLCTILNQEGKKLKKGQVILAGSATQAVALEPGMKASLEVQELGRFSVSVTK